MKPNPKLKRYTRRDRLAYPTYPTYLRGKMNPALTIKPTKCFSVISFKQPLKPKGVCFPSEIMTNIIDFLRPRPKSKNCIDTVAQLKIICRENKLKVSGTKIELIHRLLKHGLYAKRPFWDTVENSKYWGLTEVCPVPLLTFQKHLHTKQSWDELTESLYNNLNIYNNITSASTTRIIEYIRFQMFFKKNITIYENAMKMHNKHMHQMDKFWKKTPESFYPPSWTAYLRPITKTINNPYIQLHRTLTKII